MTTGVVLLNFGEPAAPDREAVVDYLQRIFLANADLEEAEDPAERARTLAQRRAPGLIEEYEEIGGSPLNEQATAQADRLEELLAERGHDAETFSGMQYTEPFVEDAVERAQGADVDELLALPGYPLCGPSTTIMALEELQDALAAADWDVPVQEVTGWHTHPEYRAMRAAAIQDFADREGFDLAASGTELVFSAHGTPRHYLAEGSRYDQYVSEHCEAVRERLPTEDYVLGYQNHENRDIPWTEPEVGDLIEDLGRDDGVERVVVDPVSFIHEQSETLMELDVELREEADTAGLDFHRVPIPHDDPRMERTFADLLEPFLGGTEPGMAGLAQCECRDRPGTLCLNAPHEE
ncbi:MAG: ferrochelatase [Haloarculaceae archaeon]